MSKETLGDLSLYCMKGFILIDLLRIQRIFKAKSTNFII